MQQVPKPRCCWTAYCRGGQLLLLLKGHFEKAAFSGGLYLLMRVEAVSVYSLSTNIYYDYKKLEELSDLKIFLNASAGHWKRCVGPHLAHGPLQNCDAACVLFVRYLSTHGILHWIVLTLSTLHTRNGSCITLLLLHHNHKMSISYHKNGLVSSHQTFGRWFILRTL